MDVFLHVTKRQKFPNELPKNQKVTYHPYLRVGGRIFTKGSFGIEPWGHLTQDIRSHGL